MSWNQNAMCIWLVLILKPMKIFNNFCTHKIIYLYIVIYIFFHEELNKRVVLNSRKALNFKTISLGIKHFTASAHFPRPMFRRDVICRNQAAMMKARGI